MQSVLPARGTRRTRLARVPRGFPSRSIRAGRIAPRRMESTASTPPASTSGSRLLPPVPGPISSTPNTSESFRNVRPLQTAFASNGLVSKRRRGTMVDSKSEATVRYGAVDMERASSLDAVQKENSFHHPRPLREVVETAMAERSFSKKSVAVMPDTPVKPSFAMSEAASAARVHRRGRSMGGPFPSRSPLFPTPPRSTYFNAPGTEAPRASTRCSALGTRSRSTSGRRRRRSRSALWRRASQPMRGTGSRRKAYLRTSL